MKINGKNHRIRRLKTRCGRLSVRVRGLLLLTFSSFISSFSLSDGLSFSDGLSLSVSNAFLERLLLLFSTKESKLG